MVTLKHRKKLADRSCVQFYNTLFRRIMQILKMVQMNKVRGQTPKVEAGERKKKKTGRAKRRIQYVRRFVNVVETFDGRKKGPNSNSE